MTTSPPNAVRVVPKASAWDEGTIVGNSCSGMSNSSSRSGSQRSSARFISMVRLALVTSVRC